MYILYTVIIYVLFFMFLLQELPSLDDLDNAEADEECISTTGTLSDEMIGADNCMISQFKSRI